MSSLIWKEWHEQSWKVGFGCVVLVALAVIGLHSRIVSDETLVMWVCCLGLSLLPILAGAALLPAERSDGTFESLMALPVEPWKILLAKTVIGLVLCAGPMAAAAIASLLIAGARELPRLDMINIYAQSTLAGISLFIWILALTSRLPSEARAGLVALGILIFWCLATVGLGRLETGGAAVAFAVSPLALIHDFATPVGFTPIVYLAAQALLLLMLWFWTSRRIVDFVEADS